MEETRTCKVCGETYPLTLEYFRHNGSNPKTFRHVCNKCRLAQEKVYREDRKAANDGREARNRESKRRWKKNHPEQNIAQIVRRTRERQHEDAAYKWTLEARRAARSALNAHKAAHFSDDRVRSITGLGKRELQNHLLATFHDLYGYDWDFAEPTHIDHIIPLCTATSFEETQQLFHYTNLRLVKETDNWAKGTRLDYQIGGDN